MTRRPPPKSADRRLFLNLAFPGYGYVSSAIDQNTFLPTLDTPTKAGIALWSAALLAGCGTSVDIDQGSRTVDFAFKHRVVTRERLINGGNTGDYRILDIDPQSLKANLTNSPVTDADRLLKDQQDQMNDSLDNIQTVLQLQKKGVGGEWENVMLPGSMASKSVMVQFGNYFSQHGINHDDVSKANFMATVFNPTLSSAEKMNQLTQYISVPNNDTAAEIAKNLDLVAKFAGDIPDNAPWDFIYDAYTSADGLSATDNLGIVAENTETLFSLFVPKDAEKQKTKEELGDMFIPIGELTKPSIYVTEYQTITPPKDVGGQPTYQQKSQMITYYGLEDERNNMVDYIPSQCKDHPEMMMSTSLPPDVEVQLAGSVLSAQQINPDNIDYGWIPAGMKEDKGYVTPVVFFNYEKDFTNSKVLVANDGSIMNRVDSGKKNWVTKVTATIDSLHNSGATEAFRYGLLPTKHAFGRIFKGRKVNSTTNQDEFPNLAVFPNDQNLVDTLAALYMQGQTLDQWGVATYQGGSDNGPTLGIQSFTATNNPLNLFESLRWKGEISRIEPGAFYNVTDIVKYEGEHVVPYSETHTGVGFQSIDGIGNPLRELADSVMVMGTKHELEYTMKTLGKIAPWALIAIAAFIQPELLLSNLWRVLTWVASKVPFLGLASEIDQEEKILAESPMLAVAAA